MRLAAAVVKDLAEEDRVRFADLRGSEGDREGREAVVVRKSLAFMSEEEWSKLLLTE